MISKNKLPWLEIGYSIFSAEGPKGLRVEVIARAMGKSKSSFYHHFGDLEGFVNTLLNYHEERGNIIAKRAQACTKNGPRLIAFIYRSKGRYLI